MRNSLLGHRGSTAVRLLTVLLLASISSLRAQTPAPAQPPAAQPAQVSSEANLDGISYASKPGILYVSIKELCEAIGEAVSINEETDQPSIKGHDLKGVRHIADGSGIMPVGDATTLGADVKWNDVDRIATITYNSKVIKVKDSGKAVVVDKAQQALMAYQGSHLVLLTHVSTGRPGHNTPNGYFTAGPVKERMHLSRLYNEAQMPYSVQVNGNVFIHGFGSVPDEPASHGCIRMPMTGANAARSFFNWVTIGTPVTVKGAWSYRYASLHRHRHRRHTGETRYASRHRRHHRSTRGYVARHRSHRSTVISASRIGSGETHAASSPVVIDHHAGN